MKVEFIGTYDSHEIRKTSKDKDYVYLVCKQAVDNKKVTILLFNQKVFGNLEMFKQGDEITIIYETWYNSNTKQQVLVCKDIV